jgi:hypothetical protein
MIMNGVVSRRFLVLLSLTATVLCALPLAAQTVPLTNWPVPRKHLTASANGDISQGAIFIAITPCRILDTRNANGAFGGPIFSSGETRSYTIPAGPCPGIPVAAAYSLNFAIVSYSAGMYLTAYPTGTSRPVIATINAGSGPPVGNAAIVPASASGSIDVYAAGSTHIIIDINGYFEDSRAFLDAGEQLSLFGTVDGSAVIRGENVSTSSSVYTSGVRGVVDATSANISGVFGESTGNGANYGVKGYHDFATNNGAGVLGYLYDRTNATVTFFPAGVRGEAGAAVANGIGVLGVGPYIGVSGGYINPSTGAEDTQASLGLASYGVYSNGDIGATGTKFFVEPHPTDAAKVIRYVSLEGPEAGTYFRGRGRFVNRQAVIDVPESFRLVTDEEGLTVHITPMGGVASVGVMSASLDRIVAASTSDVEFSYIVHGVRKGYKEYEPIIEGPEFVPQSADARIPASLNAVQKQHVIDNGTYNADGTVNMKTALRLGWDKTWAAGHRAAKVAPAAAEKK